MKNSLRAAVFFIILAAALIGAAKAGAAANPAQGKLPAGVTISPAFQQASVAAGEQQHPVVFKITNNESSAKTFDLSVQDFNTLGETGGLFFAGANPTELQKKYGLAKWLSLPQTSITIQPKQTATVQAMILNLPDLAPGGHYGALMLRQQSAGQSAGANKVAVHPIASSLLFVTKIGGDTHKLSLASVSFSRTLFSLPGSVQLRFHNDGNTHLVPRGTVYIKTAGGKLVSKGIINEDSAIILPETYRQYVVNLQNAGGLSVSGKYQLHADFRFDGIDIYRTYRQDFIVIRFWTILVIAAIILAAAGFFIFIKKFKK